MSVAPPMENPGVTKLSVAEGLSLPSPATASRVTQSTQPTYAAGFRCIGPSCEDPCCGDWDIPLDKGTYDVYQQFPLKKLGSTVSQFVILNEPRQPYELYAQIRRAPTGLCPFFGSDHLCSIQKEYGSPLLSSTCSIYPRSLSLVAERLEGSLSLSCPEAARNVLLIPDSLERMGDLYSGAFRTDNVYLLSVDRDTSAAESARVFLALRLMLIEMVRDRSRPLWRRLLMIGHVVKGLDALSIAGGEGRLLSELRNLRLASEGDAFQAELDVVPSQPRLRLRVVFGLTDALVRSGVGRRFQDTFWRFVEGIGTTEPAAPGDDIRRLLEAEGKYHRPFFETFPFILENYLINYMFQNLFPYGRQGSADSHTRTKFGEYLKMTTQFAWVNTLLIGTAGHHKEAFTGEHVVKTVQSFTRNVEHDPSLSKTIQEYIRSCALNSLEGMAVMLKA